MVSAEVVNPTKQHLAAYLQVLRCCPHISDHIYQFIHEANVFIKGEYLDAFLQKYNYIHCSCYVLCTGSVNRH